MVNQLPHIEDSTLTHYIPPTGKVYAFHNDEHLQEKLREWGLVTTKASKEVFLYKGKDYQRNVEVLGYQPFGDKGSELAVISFEDGNLSCILPAYLKEMQAPNFGKELTIVETDSPAPNEQPAALKTQKTKSRQAEKPKLVLTEEIPKNEKPALPEGKVHFHAVVKGITTHLNSFTQEEEEVLLFEEVLLTGEVEQKIGQAWAGYSLTLKKLDAKEGDKLEFDGKIVKRKLNEEVMYKINNPSKLKKT